MFSEGFVHILEVQSLEVRTNVRIFYGVVKSRTVCAWSTIVLWQCVVVLLLWWVSFLLCSPPVGSISAMMIVWRLRGKKHTHTHTHTQPFNGLLYGTTRVGRYQKKHSPTHTHPDHRTSFIIFLHLQRSMASSLFSLQAWQSSRTTYLQVLFAGPLWSSSWPWTLNFILHAFLHPIIIFSQHMPIQSQPVLLLYWCYVIHS